MKLVDQIIWYEESISEFESVISIQQKFCHLNVVGPNIFLNFINSIDALQSRSRRIRSVVSDLTDGDIAVLGRALCLSKTKWRFGGIDNYFPAIAPAARYSIDTIRYCASCANIGYHSYVHQAPWLNRCVVHGDILQERCLACGRFFAIERTIGFVCSCCGTKLWPSIDKAPWPVALSADQLGSISEYVRWVKRCNSNRRAVLIHRAFEFSGGTQPAGREIYLNALVKPPASTTVAWVPADKKPPNKFHLQLGNTNSRLIASAIDEFGYGALLSFSTRQWCNVVRIDPIERVLASVARHLARKHRRCARQIHCLLRAAEPYSVDSYRPMIESSCSPIAIANQFNARHTKEWRLPPIALEAADSLSEDGRIRDWFISNGLLHRSRSLVANTKSHLASSNVYSILDRDSRTYHWSFDRSVIQFANFLLKIKVRIKFGTEIGYLLNSEYTHFADIDLKEDPSLRTGVSGAFILTFHEQEDLVFYVWYENTLSCLASLFKCRSTHYQDVRDFARTLCVAMKEHNDECFRARAEELERGANLMSSRQSWRQKQL